MQVFPNSKPMSFLGPLSPTLCRISESHLQCPRGSSGLSHSLPSIPSPIDTSNLTHITCESSTLSAQSYRSMTVKLTGTQTHFWTSGLILTITHQTLPQTAISCLYARGPPSIPSYGSSYTYLTEGEDWNGRLHPFRNLRIISYIDHHLHVREAPNNFQNKVFNTTTPVNQKYHNFTRAVPALGQGRVPLTLSKQDKPVLRSSASCKVS